MSEHPPSPKRPFWREYLAEIILAGIILIGIFLLVERMDIRVTLWHGLSTLLGGLTSGLELVIGQSVQRITSMTLSDLVGLTLIVVAVVAVLWRVRWRLIHDQRFASDTCPRCGGELHRIHRTRLDHIVNLFVPARRHRCKNKDCDWSGLRFGHSNKHRRVRQSQPK
jgi:hypothetical protein